MNNNLINVIPIIVMPSKDFLIGVLYGFNAARKRIEENPQPIINNREVQSEDFFLGYWLEFSCPRCGRYYAYDNPNDIPSHNLVCETPNCGNHVIIYGFGDPKVWRLGNISLV